MKNTSKVSLAACILFAAAVLYRLILGFAGNHAGFLNNFSPLAAVALCGGIYLPRRLAFVIPLAALFVSDLVLNWHYGYSMVSVEMISRYLALAASVGIGLCLRDRARLTTVLPASILGSFIFYVLTNTSSWITWPGYAKTLSGWVQALTTGIPRLHADMDVLPLDAGQRFPFQRSVRPLHGTYSADGDGSSRCYGAYGANRACENRRQ